MLVLSAFGAFALSVLLHGLAMRTPAKLDSVRRFLLVGLPVGLVLTAFALVRYGLTLRAAGPILLYAFLCELYIFLFTLALSSVSAAMLVRLRGGDGGAAGPEREDPDAMVTMRLERLLKNGFVARADGRLSLTAKGRRLHQGFITLRRFFRHPAQ